MRWRGFSLCAGQHFAPTIPAPYRCSDAPNQTDSAPIWRSFRTYSKHPRGDHGESAESGRLPAWRRRARPAATRIHASRPGGDAQLVALRREASPLRRARPAGTPGRTGTRHPVPHLLDRRPRPRPGQPRLPHPAQLRDRPLQGRHALSPVGEPVDPEIPRLRTDPEELADHAAHGRRQGRFRLRPQGQVRRRSHALLPGADDRAVPPSGSGHRCARRRYRRGRA